jgi:hypothetical protein
MLGSTREQSAEILARQLAFLTEALDVGSGGGKAAAVR